MGKKPYSRAHRVRWQTHYNELVSYKEANGHCAVPQKYTPNPKLGLWVMQQRRQHALQETGKRSSFNGPEGEKRRALLDEAGFLWRVGRLGRKVLRDGTRSWMRWISKSTWWTRARSIRRMT